MHNNKRKGLGITVKDHESINQALKRFKRKVEDSGKLEDLRKKEYYEKPTAARKRAAGAAKARYRKKLQKEQAAIQALQQRR